MRCEIGWPTVTFVPGSSDTFSRISRSTSSLDRSFISSRTSISADSTPCTCSSSSARPVRRAVEATSGTPSSRRSSALPSAFESARLVPGIVTALTVSAPSLNSGRNERPAAEQGDQRGDQRDRRTRDHQSPRAHGAMQPRLVDLLELPGQPRLRAVAIVRGVRQQQRAQHRRDREGDDERRDQRDDVGKAQRPQQAALDAAQQEQRHEDDGHDHGGEHDRRADLGAGVVDHRQRVPPLSRRQRRVLAQAPHDVLDVDDRVVDQLADGNGQSAQAHGVEREAEPVHGDGGGNQRERQRDERDGGGAHVHQEHHHHEDDEAGAFEQRLEQVVERLLDEVGAAKQVLLNLHPLGQGLLDLVERGVDAFGQLERVGARLLLDADDHRRARVVRAVAALDRRAFTHGREIPNQDRRLSRWCERPRRRCRRRW